MDMYASLSNACAYLILFTLLHWLPPSLVEAVSTFAGFVATFSGVMIFRETRGDRKIQGSLVMTAGVIIMLLDHYQTEFHNTFHLPILI